MFTSTLVSYNNMAGVSFYSKGLLGFKMHPQQFNPNLPSGVAPSLAPSWHWKSIIFLLWRLTQYVNSMKLVIPLHFYLIKKDSKRCCDTTTPESIHTKDESKRGFAFAFIFGVNWPLQWMKQNDKFHGFMWCGIPNTINMKWHRSPWHNITLLRLQCKSCMHVDGNELNCFQNGLN